MISFERLSAALYPKTLNLTGAAGGRPEFGTDDWNHLRGRLASRDKLSCAVIESLFSEPVALTAECAAMVKLAQLKRRLAELARIKEKATDRLNSSRADASAPPAR